MRKKRLVILALTVLVLGGVVGGVLAALKHEPGFYRRGAVEAGPDRQKHADEFMKQFAKLINRVLDGRGKWGFSFTEEQLNSYFEEDFIRLGDADALARSNIHAPRVRFDDDSMRVAFRYGSGFWSTVLTYEVRIWLVPKELNTLAVEILQRKAGGVPIAAQSLLNDFKELARNKNIDMSWYRHEGNPVALLRFSNSRSRPSAQFTRFEVDHGRLVIEGQSFEPGAQAEIAMPTP